MTQGIDLVVSPTSGAQLEIALGNQRAVVVEAGGGLRSYSVGDRDIVDGYDAGEMCTSGRGQVLVPWPNRIEDGSYEFEGRRHQLPLTEPESRNAIHGLVRWASWRVAERQAHRVVMEHTLDSQPGYPFSLALSIEYTLSEQGLRVQTAATNVGLERCPFGAGAHPYLRVSASPVNGANLSVPAWTVLQSDERGLPMGAHSVDNTEFDFRQPRPIGATALDHAFTDLDCDTDGLARVLLENPADGTGVALWVDQHYPYLMLFTGDPLPDVNRCSLAVEPMTCPPNAFRSGQSLIVLEPGQSWTGAWGIDPFAA